MILPEFEDEAVPRKRTMAGSEQDYIAMCGCRFRTRVAFVRGGRRARLPSDIGSSGDRWRKRTITSKVPC